MQSTPVICCCCCCDCLLLCVGQGCDSVLAASASSFGGFDESGTDKQVKTRTQLYPAVSYHSSAHLTAAAWLAVTVHDACTLTVCCVVIPNVVPSTHVINCLCNTHLGVRQSHLKISFCAQSPAGTQAMYVGQVATLLNSGNHVRPHWLARRAD